MKRLIIDDMRTLDVEGTTVRTTAEAIPMLDEQWDEIWLDYDMAGRWEFETEDDLTIMPVVDRLIEIALNNREDKRVTSQIKAEYPGFSRIIKEITPDLPIIFVHTGNPVGRQRITAALSRYYDVRQVMLAAHRKDGVSVSQNQDEESSI